MERIDCPVDDDIGVEWHQEINAFRVLPEVGEDFLLDFIHYQPANNKALVVRRVRLHRASLDALFERLRDDLIVLDANSPLVVVWPENNEVH